MATIGDPIPNGIQFHGEPLLRPTTDGYHWHVAEDYHFHDPILGDITVKADFDSDLGSIPREFWNIIPPIGAPLRAYLLHDWLYWMQFCTREEADNCLLRMMIALGVGEVERMTIYEAVRLGGQSAWDSDAAKKAAQATS